MAAVFCKCLGPCLLVGLHGGAFAVIAHQQMRWDSMLRGSNYELAISATLLACFGADVGLLGVWTAVSKRHLAVRWLTTVACLACWCFIYRTDLNFMLRHWSDPQRQEQLFWNALFSVCVGLSQAALISGALLLARRRGYRMLR